MSDCKLRSWAVSDPVNGYATAQTVCYTHGFRFPEGAQCSGLCPVGTIEKAIETGVERIIQTIKDHTNAIT